TEDRRVGNCKAIGIDSAAADGDRVVAVDRLDLQRHRGERAVEGNEVAAGASHNVQRFEVPILNGSETGLSEINARAGDIELCSHVAERVVQEQRIGPVVTPQGQLDGCHRRREVTAGGYSPVV